MSYMRNIFHNVFKMKLKYVNGGHLIAISSMKNNTSNTSNTNNDENILTNLFNDYQKELTNVEKNGKLPDKQSVNC